MCTSAIRFPVKALICAEDVAAESGDALSDDVLGTRCLLVEVDAVEGGALRVRPVHLVGVPFGGHSELLGDGAGSTRLTADTDHSRRDSDLCRTFSVRWVGTC